MTTEAEAPVETKELTQEQAIVLIEKEYPENFMRLRRIHHLWDFFYRVNIHDLSNDNKIIATHFVVVANGRVLDNTK